MTKAALSIVCFVILCAAVPAVHAQSTAINAAVQEAVHRQADTIMLRQKLVQAESAAPKDPEAAAILYDEAWNLVQRIGSGIDTETAETKAGLAAVRLELATAAQKRGDLKAADVNVKDILRVDPQNPAAVAFKRENDKLLAAQRGRIPSDETLSQIPNVQAAKVNASTLVQDGKLLFEMGKFDEAETKLKKALAMDPQNYEAIYYMGLIQQALNKQATEARDMTSNQRMVEIEQAWTGPIKRESLPVPNPYAHTNLIYTSRGRQAIMSKLDRIRLDSVMYDGLPLSEVVRNLSEEAKKRDPEKTGINFIINPTAEAAVTITNTAGFGGAGGGFPPGLGGPGAPGEAGGVPVVSAPPQPVDVASIPIRLNPGLSNVRLADVLDAICKVADTPIKYSIEDYAVVFSLKGSDQAPLYIRTYRVDPNTFYQGLESVGALSFGSVQTGTGGAGGGGGGGGAGGQNGQASGVSLAQVFVAGIAQGTGGGGGGGGGATLGGGGGGGGGTGVGVDFVTHTNATLGVQQAVRDFFSTMGVDLNPPKSVFFNDRSGVLLVRATLQDLDVIEAAVQALNVAPPMINIKTRFAEISQNDAKALGFDWYLGNFLMNNNSVGLQGGSAPAFQSPPTAANPTGVFPTGGGVPSASDQLLTGGLRNLFTPSGSTTSQTVPSLFTLTGLLTDPQFRTVIHALEQRNGVNLLNAPELTTLSGRQAQVQVIDVQTIVTGVNANQTASGGTTGTTGAGGGGAVGSTISYTEQPLPFGPILDVIPYVCADGYTIQMTIIPTYTQFLGYDDPGGFAVQAQSIGSSAVAAGTLTAALPLPHFRVRQVTTSAVVWDGQTVVLGGLISENVVRQKDKVPFLGDIPWLGTLFQSQQNISQKNNLMIFVTPTIIDPAGNRYHTDDEMPFAQNAIPPQQSQGTQ